jgi:cyclopropane fatty-acyl-phospholipid synthase-like methyltransferase
VFPAESVLEIAVGYGRITQYLDDYCDQLYGVDLNLNCVNATRERLPHALIELTDGVTIPFDVPFDLVISWDSLVHCHPDIVKSYITESSKLLNDYGMIFLHHSTWASSGAPGNPHWRNEESDHRDIAEHARSLGLSVEQEVIKWGYEYPTDCLTTLKWER